MSAIIVCVEGYGVRCYYGLKCVREAARQRITVAYTNKVAGTSSIAYTVSHGRQDNTPVEMTFRADFCLQRP